MIIGYDMIIVRDLMLQLGLLSNLKRQFLQQDGVAKPMKEPRSILEKKDLTSCKMRRVVMKNTEPVSTREYTEGLVKILNSANVKVNLEHVADNVTQMNSGERTQLISLLQYF